MYNGCSKSVVALPSLYFHWSLGPVGSFVLRVWGIVCIVSSVLFFCFPIRPCLESEILRVSAASRSLLLFSWLIFWPLVCSTTPPTEILLYQLLSWDTMFIIINLQIISPKVYFVFSRNSLPGFPKWVIFSGSELFVELYPSRLFTCSLLHCTRI